MAVVTKTFTGTLSDTSTTSITIKGLTSETSTTNVNGVNIEATRHFLNALYQTLLEAGYEDTEINEDEYYVTILGSKVFSYVEGGGTSYFRVEGYGGYVVSNSGLIYNSVNLYYGIVLRGGENNVRIKLLCSNSSGILSATENNSLMIFNAKNILSGNSAYIYAVDFEKGYAIIREKSLPYNLTYYNSIQYGEHHIFSKYLTSKGNNTSDKFAVVPQLAYENSYVVPGMIQGNTAIFTNDKYYRIGTDTYYCENGYLYRVD